MRYKLCTIRYKLRLHSMQYAKRIIYFKTFKGIKNISRTETKCQKLNEQTKNIEFLSTEIILY